jgi:hypothetical protein
MAIYQHAARDRDKALAVRIGETYDHLARLRRSE